MDYRLANHDSVQNTKKLTSFPNYHPNNILTELLSLDSLDGWNVTIGNEGDTVEVVNEIDTTLWNEDAKNRINPIIPNGKFSCIKMKAHSGTEISYLFDSPMDFTNESWGMLVFIDTISSGDISSSADIIEVRLHSANTRDIYLFRVRTMNCYDNNWFLFSFHPADYKTWNAPDLSNIHGVKIKSGLPVDVDATIYISSLFRIDNNITRGKILMDFDDNFLSSYTEAYKYMTGKYGYKGNLFINGNKQGINYVTVNQMLRMQEDGWVIGNHTWQHINWRGKPYEEQKENLVKNMEWMAQQGFWYGNQIYAATNYALDYNMFHNLKQNGFKIIRAGYNNGRGGYMSLPITKIPSCQPILSNETDNTVSLETWKSHLEDIQNSKALAVNVFHDISTTSSTSVEHFRLLIDEIQNYDIDVVTYADLLMDKVK